LIEDYNLDIAQGGYGFKPGYGLVDARGKISCWFRAEAGDALSARASVSMSATMDSRRNESARQRSRPAWYSCGERRFMVSSWSEDLITATAVLSSWAASLTKARCCRKERSRR